MVDMRLVQTNNTTILDARVALVEAFIANVVKKTVNNMVDIALRDNDSLTIEALKKLNYVSVTEENIMPGHTPKKRAANKAKAVNKGKTGHRGKGRTSHK